MEREDRRLFLVLLLLAASVLTTGGLAICLTLQRSGKGIAAEVSAPRIAFVSDREGQPAIYVAQADGSHARRLSPEGRPAFFPSWSPDGQWVAYLVGEPGTEGEGPAGVWVAAADGTQRTPVSAGRFGGGGLAAVWSPDGTALAFLTVLEPTTESGPNSAICIVRPDSGQPLQTVPLPEYIISAMHWAPDGQSLLVVAGTSDSQAGVYTLSRQDAQMVPVFPAALAADWSPNGEEMVVGSLEGRVVLLGRAGRELARLTSEIPQEVVWSPDGRHIAVATARQAGWEFSTALYIVGLEAGDLARVVDGEGWLGWANWSPDGNRLLFTMGPLRHRPGTDLPYGNLWVYDMGSGQLQQLTTDTGFTGLGVWSP